MLCTAFSLFHSALQMSEQLQLETLVLPAADVFHNAKWKEPHGEPSFASTSGRCDVISTGTLALVRGCLFFLMLILGLVFLALRKERPIRPAL